MSKYIIIISDSTIIWITVVHVSHMTCVYLSFSSSLKGFCCLDYAIILLIPGQMATMKTHRVLPLIDTCQHQQERTELNS